MPVLLIYEVKIMQISRRVNQIRIRLLKKAKQAMEAGKNVIVEKLVALAASEAQELCDLAKEKKVLFSVYQNRRLDGDFLTVKKILDEGRLGEVLNYEVHYDRFVTGPDRKKWKAEGGRGNDILYDLGVHIIDQAYALFGMPDEVYADFRKQREESNDIDNFEVILYYKDKKAILSAGEAVAMPGPHFMVHGRKGSFIKYGMDVQENTLIAGNRPPMEDWGKEDPSMYGILTTHIAGQVEPIVRPIIPGNYGKYYDNIYKALTEDAPLLVNPSDTVAVLKIIEAAIESNKSKKRENV